MRCPRTSSGGNREAGQKAHGEESLGAAGHQAGYKLVRNMDYSQAEDYLAAKAAQIKIQDREGGYDQGIKQFIDDKTYKPGLGPMARVDKDS